MLWTLSPYRAITKVKAPICPRGGPQPILHDLFPPSQSPLPLDVPMSASNQTAGPSTDNFSSIFNAALNEYHRFTKKSLDTHPLAAQLDSCQNPEAISILFRTQAQAFTKFREGDERLMEWLDPTIHILLTFSDTLGEGIGLVRKPPRFAHDISWTSNSQAFSPAKTIFTGIGILLGVCFSACSLLRV